jgi:putative NIF3 family GTP cyclohydrolase 1 type 2
MLRLTVNTKPKAIPVVLTLTDAVIDSVIAKGADTIKSCLESIKNGSRIATQVQILKLENGSK